MFWRIFRHVLMDEANAGEGGGASAGTEGGGAAAGAGGDQGGQAGAGGSGAQGSGAAPAGSGGSVLAAAAGGQQPAGTPQIPEKYQVKKEDGSLDIEASSLKLAEAYGHLEKRMGSGDVPPKTAEEYQITVPDALKDAIDPKADPLMGEFLKDAHAAGLTQKQIDLVMGKYFELAPQLLEGTRQLSNDECVADLRAEWKTDEQFKGEVNKAFKAAQAYGGSDTEAILREYGNDPRIIRMLARVGGEMGEDTSLNPGGTMQGGQSVETLMMSEAYTNPKHPEHAKVSAQVQGYFDKLSKSQARAGNVPLI